MRLANAAAAANVTALGSWRACEAHCDAEPSCLLWSLRPAHRDAAGAWMPAACRLAAEPVGCTPAYCRFPGGASGLKRCQTIPAVARRTAAAAVDIRVVSGGFSDGNTAAFVLDGMQLGWNTTTGMNVAVLHRNGTFSVARTFNTHEAGSASDLLVAFLRALDRGTPVLVAARDDAKAGLSSGAKAAIAECGASQIQGITYRASYALIGIKGGAKLAEELFPEGGGMAEATATYASPVSYDLEGMVNVRVKSEGYNSQGDGTAEFYIDDQRLFEPSGRGFNVVVLMADGSVNSSHIFDTHGPYGSTDMVELLERLQLGTPVLVAVRDDARPGLSPAAVAALRSFGATLIADLGYRSAYALIGIKGGPKLAEMVLAEGEGVVEITALYQEGFTTTTTTELPPPSSTTVTTTQPLCSDYLCPSGRIVRLDAPNVSGNEEEVCCEDAPENVVSAVVKSAGWGNGDLAQFYVAGARLSVQVGRGMNLVVLDRDASVVRLGGRPAQTFDTHTAGPSANLSAFLGALENGTRVLLAAKDEAAVGLSDEAQAAIESLGARQIRQLRYRGAYALVGVKGGLALAETLRQDRQGLAAAVAHLRAATGVPPRPARPVCSARQSNPPVSGFVTANGQLELDAGCRYELWEGANAADCLQGSWMVVVGGSNTVLMAIRLANMLARRAIMPVRDGATMGGFTVVDVIIRDGQVLYNNSQKLSGCTALPYDSACGAAIAELVAEAPAYSRNTGATRITLFEARFWDHADTALETVIADARWVAAPMALIVQVSTWYIYCASMKVTWCPRPVLAAPNLTHAQALNAFAADMAPVVSKLEVLCTEGGRAALHGCALATTSWQNPSASRLQAYLDYNAAIATALDGKASERLRLVDLWTLGQAFPDENILGHASPMLNLWNWQVILGGMCPSEKAAAGTFAEFSGALCSGPRATRVRVSVGPPAKYDLAQATGELCPEYWSACPNKGGGHLRCEPWECATSVACNLTAVVVDTPWIEANLSGACAGPIAWDSSLPAAEERCKRVWCSEGLEFVPVVVAVALVLAVFTLPWLWDHAVPERLRNTRCRAPAEDPKQKQASGQKPASVTQAGGGKVADPPAQGTAAALPEGAPGPSSQVPQPHEAGASDGPVPALLLSLQALSEKPGEKPKAAASPRSPHPAGPAVSIEVKEPPHAHSAQAGGTSAEASTASQLAKVDTKPKGAGDKFPLGLARMCASLHVVVGHLYAKTGVVPQVYFFGWGFTWVPWFFMLSGFVLFTAHLRRPKEEGVFEYVMRRSVSIYPLYAVSLIPAFAIAKSLDITPDAIILVAQSWLLQAWVPNWTEKALQMHCWFLSAMVVYWFLFKPLSRCLRAISLRSTVVLMSILFALPWFVVIVPALAGQEFTWSSEHSHGRTTTWLDLAVVFLKFHPLCYLHVFVLGMLLARLRLLLDARAVTAGSPLRWRLPMEFVAPAGYAGLLLIFLVKAIRPWGTALSARLSVLLPLQAAILFGLAGLPSLPRGRVAALASRLDFLENYSYAVYVFQFVCYSVWPKAKHISLPLFLAFLIATAVSVVHLVQRPVQRWWCKHPRSRWCIPVLLSLALGSLEVCLPRPEMNADLPALVRHDGHMVDVRLPLVDGHGSEGTQLINPSLLIERGQVILAARRHRFEVSQRNDDGSCGRYNASGCTIQDQTWHSDIAVGSAPLDGAAWARWPATGSAPFEAELSTWAALRTPEGEPWAGLCTREAFDLENGTVVRRVVTGPEDPKLVRLGNGTVAVVFSSLPPRGADGCLDGTDSAAVSQMYLAEYSQDPVRDVGRHLDFGRAEVDEKNWVPFVNETGHLFFAYQSLPHDIISCERSGTCSLQFSSSFQPLQQFQRSHPQMADWRGSAQAVLVDAPAATPNLPRRHFLGLIHAVERSTRRYAHFACRFTAEAPHAILQVSSELPLQAARSDAGGAPFAFASGLAVHNGTVAVFYGAGDRDARALVMTLERLDQFFSCNNTGTSPGEGSNATNASTAP